MSNRLCGAGRIPLMPEPLLAARAGTIFSESRLQSLQVSALGRAFFELPATLWNLVHSLGKTIENAVRLRDVACMSDHLLRDIGIRRDQLPQLFIEGRLADIAGDRRSRHGDAAG